MYIANLVPAKNKQTKNNNNKKTRAEHIKCLKETLRSQIILVDKLKDNERMILLHQLQYGALYRVTIREIIPDQHICNQSAK